MLPPVTTRFQCFHMTPHSTCIAVWVRIIRRRRSSSTSPVTGVPTAGTGPAIVCRRCPSTVRTSVTVAAPVAHTRWPVSCGWPPLVA